MPISCVDVAVLLVMTYAQYLGKIGYESKKELDSDKEFLERLEELRQGTALKMGLGDVSKSISPKICMLTPPRDILRRLIAATRMPFQQSFA